MLKVILGAVIFLFAPMVGFGSIAQFLGAALVVWGIVGVIKGANAEQSTERSFGDSYKYSYFSGKTGIAICPERQLVKLKEKSNTKEYGFDMIRSWESNNQTGGNIVNAGSGFAGAVTTASANVGQNIANKNASGFFVFTKDIENVTWRVEMLDRKEQAKWMEIMRQSISEA